MVDKRTDAIGGQDLPKKHDEMAAQVAGIAQKTKETLDNMSRRYISEDMLQTVAGAMGEHSAPALLYVGTDGKVTRVDWDALGEDDREIEIFLGLLRIAAGRHIDWNAPSTEALRPTGRRPRG
jgi:transposase